MSLIDVPMHAAHVLVTALAQFLTPLVPSCAVACTIVLFTLGVRTLLIPLSIQQIRGDRARAALAPKIQELRETHAKNPEKVQRETLALQQEHGTLFAGCLPSLAQLPFFYLTYQLFSSPILGGVPNELLHHELFGAPLGSGLGSALGAHPAVCLVILALLAAVAWWSSRLMSRSGPNVGVLRLLPFGSVVFALFVPVAASLYLLVTTAWTVAQRALFGAAAVSGAGGIEQKVHSGQ